MRHRVLTPLVLTATLLAGVTGCAGADDEAQEPKRSPAAAASPKQDAAGEQSGAQSGEQSGDIEVDPAAQRYVDAVADKDLDGLVGSFHKDALAVDVSREFRGHDAIRDWAESEVIGGSLTVLKSTPKENGTTLLVRFEPGGFEANYAFDVRDGLIEELRLTYA